MLCYVMMQKASYVIVVSFQFRQLSQLVRPPATIATQFFSNTSSQFQTFHKPVFLTQLCNQGNLRQAFFFLSNSKNQHLTPTPKEYASLLDLCAFNKAISQGRQIHAHIAKLSCFLLDGFLPTKLIFMYGKCGFLKDAHHLFDEMPDRTIFSWNALIGAYVNTGDLFHALNLYHKMQISEFIPDACTFALVLKSCGGLENFNFGRGIHGLIIKYGLQTNTLVANSLLCMYSKCGYFNHAFDLFRQLDYERDMVSWNSIISASVQNGQFLDALNLFREMQRHGLRWDSYTIVGILQACAELSLSKLGREIHAMQIKKFQLFDVHEGNALVVLYCKCGKMDYAGKVFSILPKRDNISWNSMLSGYVQNGYNTKAMELFDRMVKLGFQPDQVSVISAASALGRLVNIRNGSELHAYALKQGFGYSLEVGNALIDMYTKCGYINYAKAVFDRMHMRDHISWTIMIAAHVQIGGRFGYLKGINLFRDAQNNRIKVDGMMVGSVLQACSRLASLYLLRQLHGYAIRNRLLDLVLRNTFTDIYGQLGKVEQSFSIFKSIQNRDVVTWTTMVNCYTNNGLFKEALEMFSEMIRNKIEPDAVGIVSVLVAIGGLFYLKKGKEIHGFIIRRNFDMNVEVNSTLVDMYSNCGSLNNCTTLFALIIRRDVVLYTAMIKALGMHGREIYALKVFNEMLERNIEPDHLAFLALLHACSHSGLVDEGKCYFDMMAREYNLTPWPEHYACIVDLLGRAGKVMEAYEFIQSMPVEPTAVVWCKLLGICQIHGEEQIASVAMARIAELEPNNPGNYVRISNFFASRGKWVNVKDVRERMREKGLRKVPGYSWNQIGNKIHNFVARYSSHESS